MTYRFQIFKQDGILFWLSLEIDMKWYMVIKIQYLLPEMIPFILWNHNLYIYYYMLASIIFKPIF